MGSGSFVARSLRRRKKSLAVLAALSLVLSLLVQLGVGSSTLAPALGAHNLNLTIDADGPDDVPAQTDVSLLGFDDSHLPDYYVAQIQFDDTTYPGGNSGDGCVFFDSDDAGGFADFAVCGSFVTNTTTGQVELVAAALYDCKNSEPNNDEGKRCPFTGGGGDGSSGIIAQDLDGDGVFESDGDGDPLGTPYDTTCSLNTTADDPFNGVGTHNTSGEQDPIFDTQLTCEIFADELVELDGDVPSGVAVSNACSFTSRDPGSESKDCVADAGSGFLKIVKNATGADATFDFTVDGQPFASITTEDGAGQTDSIPVTGGQQLDLAEVVPPGWQLDGATCDNGDDPSMLTAAAAQTVTCTFDNSLVEDPPSLVVTKTADPTALPEPGGEFAFTVSIENTSDATDPVTITSLSDDIHGDLNGQGDCSVPQTIQPGDTYTCTFSATVTGDPGFAETDTVTAAGTDDEGTDVSGSDDATVTITDVPSMIELVKTADPPSVPEPGGDVTFSFTVNNTSAVDAVTIESLVDSIYGDLNGVGDCTVPQTIAAGGAYACSFSTTVAGAPGDTETNVVSATGTDDDGLPVSGSDDATVTITDLPSAIEVIKTAAPTTVDEPGGEVTFSFTVNNTSAVDAVTIESLIDSIYGDLNGAGDCTVPQTIAAGAAYSCEITEFVGGAAGEAITNVVTVSGTDDDGDPVIGGDDAVVTINDLPSSIEVIKTANPEAVDEPGGDVTFSFTVNNTSAVDAVTIESLVDSIYGDLNGAGDCTVPQTIAAGGAYSCEITEFVGGNAGDTEINVVTALGTDDDGDPVSGTDDAVVTIADVPSAIELVKTAAPTSVDEPGGEVTFTFTVNNLSSADSVTIDSLTDSVYGDLATAAGSTCTVPQTIPAGDAYMCSLTAEVGGNAGDIHTNTATASGEDDDGNPVSDDDVAQVTINDLPSSIEIVKTADPTTVPEPGGAVTFTFEVSNLSAADSVTVESLMDSIFGDLTTAPGSTCSVPQTIAVGGGYTCTITATVVGNAGHVETNVVTAAGVDDDGNEVSAEDDATVTVEDVQSAIEVVKTASPTSVSEPGGDVTFTFVVNNLSIVDTVSIDTLDDSIHGDLDGQGDCSVPQTIAPLGSYTCSIVAFVAGNAGDIETNVVTASGMDDDGNAVAADDDAVVTVEDVPAAIEILKTAVPVTVAEPGGDVTYTFVVNNLSPADAVTITTLDDSIYGDLDGQGDCAVPQTLAVDGSYTCSITTGVSGNAGDEIVNVATASGTDDDENPVSDDDDAKVTITDLPSSLEVTKVADPGSVEEPGGDVTFTFTVNNTSAVDTVSIDTLNDSIYGDLDGQGDCSVPQTIPAGGSYSCQIAAFVGGNAGDTHTNVVTVGGVDDDGDPVGGTDSETVEVADVPSSLTTTKSASPATVPESGGDVTYTVTVANTSLVDDVTVESVIDDRFGDVSAACVPALPALLAPGETIACSFTEFVSGDPGIPHTNIVTSSGTDDDGNPVEDEDSAEVIFEDVLPAITVVKTADPTTVPEPGADVAFTFEVSNNSSEELTLDALVDDRFGDLDGKGDCALPQTLAANGGTYACAATFFVAGNAGDVHVNVVTATASDDDGNTAQETAQAAVAFSDVGSAIEVIKTADPTEVPETGGDVTFTVTVNNLSPVDTVTINSLADTVYGDLTETPGSTCVLPQEIPAGESYTCSVPDFISGQAGVEHINVVTASGVDDDGNDVSGDDDAVVTITDVPASIVVTKTADPTEVAEPGGEVAFTITIENTSAVDEVTITSLLDTVYEDVSQLGDCGMPVVIPVGVTHQCTFTANVAGNAGDTHNNVVTASGTDDDGQPVSDDDEAFVDITDVPSAISVDKTASDLEVFAPGETVTFTVVVTNDSAVDTLTIDALGDDIHGDLSGQGDCAVPQTLAPGEDYTCSFDAFVDGSETDVVTASGTDDDGNPVAAADDATVTMISPSLAIEKSTNGVDADTPPGPEITIGETVTWEYVVENTGDVPLDGIGVVDDQGVAVTCPTDTLDPGAAMTCTAVGIAQQGQYANLGTATGTAGDADGDVATVSDADPSHYLGVGEAGLDLVKSFADDAVTAGGAASSFTLLVTNTGDLTLTDVVVTDIVNGLLTVTGVDCGAGSSAGVSQDVECTFDTLAPDESATITVSFEVGAPAAANAVPANAAAAETECPAGTEPNPDGVCTSTSIRPIASCWESDGTQVIEIVNIQRYDIDVAWEFDGQAGTATAPRRGSAFVTIAGGPETGEFHVRWGRAEHWWITVTDEPCNPPAEIEVLNTASAQATSPLGTVSAEAADSVIVIGASGELGEPTADFEWACDDTLQCSFTDLSTDNGAIVAWEWVFGDGNTSTDQNPAHTYGAGGTYAVTLTVTDDVGLTDAITFDVAAFPPPDGTMHVADLDGAAVSTGRMWDAFVTITVVDQDGVPVDGAVVTGEWNRRGTGTCTTDPSGTCTVEAFGNRLSTEVFSVTNISFPTLIYEPTSNTDPDGDSDGTTIVIVRP